MADHVLNVKIQNRYDTEDHWASNNPVLRTGELAFSSDAGFQYKIGDGSTRWGDLKYAQAGSLYGLTASIQELNCLSGAAGNIQAQLDTKAETSKTGASLVVSGSDLMLVNDEGGVLATVTTQDTTYTGEEGITVDGTIIKHTNSIQADSISGTEGEIKFGESFEIPSITYDAQGHIINAETTSVLLSDEGATDEKVATEEKGAVKAYLTGTEHEGVYVGRLVYDADIYLDTTAGTLTAKIFNGDLTGNADTATATRSIRILAAKPETSTKYSLPFSDSDEGAECLLYSNDGLGYECVEGTEGIAGSATLRIGNQTVIEALGNKIGNLLIYGTGEYGWQITGNEEVENTGNYNLYLPQSNGCFVVAPNGATIGDDKTPVYINSKGVATVCEAMLSESALSDGSVTKVGTATVGGTAKGIYLDAGTPTAMSSTVGSATNPVYLSSGTVTACSTTVGGSALPIYSNGGTLTACSSTVGSGTKPVYMNSGTITVSSSTVGGSALPVYLSSGTITACSSTVGSGTKPVYMSSGTITVSSSTVGSTTQPVYLSSGTITAMSGALSTSYGGTGNTSGRATYVDITTTNPTSSTTYYIPFSTGISSGTNYSLRGNNGLRYNSLEGTADEDGHSRLYLGNNTETGTAGSKHAAIYLYGTGSNYWIISGNKATSSNRTLYLPLSGGCLVAATNASATGSSSTPVYINSSNVATACSSIGSWTKFTVTASSGSVWAASEQGATAYYNDLIKLAYIETWIEFSKVSSAGVQTLWTFSTVTPKVNQSVICTYRGESSQSAEFFLYTDGTIAGSLAVKDGTYNSYYRALFVFPIS